MHRKSYQFLPTTFDNLNSAHLSVLHNKRNQLLPGRFFLISLRPKEVVELTVLRELLASKHLPFFVAPSQSVRILIKGTAWSSIYVFLRECWYGMTCVNLRWWCVLFTLSWLRFWLRESLYWDKLVSLYFHVFCFICVTWVFFFIFFVTSASPLLVLFQQEFMIEGIVCLINRYLDVLRKKGVI